MIKQEKSKKGAFVALVCAAVLLILVILAHGLISTFFPQLLA